MVAKHLNVCACTLRSEVQYWTFLQFQGKQQMDQVTVDQKRGD